MDLVIIITITITITTITHLNPLENKGDQKMGITGENTDRNK
jgi:hypothetical protein